MCERARGLTNDGSRMCTREVHSRHQCFDEGRDLSWVSRPVRVKHDEDIAGRGLEAAAQRISLAAALLQDDLGGWPQKTRHIEGVIGREAIDDDHLMQTTRQLRQDVRQVLRLVEGGDDHAHVRPLRYEVGPARAQASLTWHDARTP